MTVLKDPAAFHRVLFVACLVLSPALMVAGVAVAPFEETSSSAAYLEAIRGDVAGAQLSAFLLHLGFMLVVPCVWAAAALIRDRAPVLANLGLVLGTLGAIGNSGVVLMDYSDVAAVVALPPGQAVRLYDEVDSQWGFVASAMLGIPVFALGFALLLVGLWRARVLAPWWLAVLPAGLALAAAAPAGRWSPLVVFATVGAIFVRLALEHAQRRPASAITAVPDPA